jgi:mono/diheme cytochrome c family protein
MRRAALLLLSALMLAVGAVACGGGEDESATPETVEGTVATTAAPAEGDPAAGEEIYSSAGCGSCHTFEPAGSSGTIGPSLDDSSASFDDAFQQIKDGGGGMPAFGDRLSDKEIADVAAFVTQGN